MKLGWICTISLIIGLAANVGAATSKTWIYQNGVSFIATPTTVSSGASSLALNQLPPTIDVSSVIVSPNQAIKSVRLVSVDDKAAHLKIDFLNRFSSAQKLTVTYLMHGLSWTPSHTLQIGKDGQSVLTSWATLTNTANTKIGPTHISLVEGRVNSNGIMPRAQVMMAAADSSAKGLPSADGGYYRIYDLGSNISLEKGETLRVQLLTPFQTTGTQTLISRNYIYTSRQTQSNKAPVSIQVALNDSLKETLPAGPVQVYQEVDDTVMWMGTSSLDDILPGKKVSFTIGQPVDVGITQSQSNYVDSAADTKARYTYQIQNSRKESITLTFVEQFSSSWTITGSSVPHQKLDAGSASFTITVPAQSTSTLWYDVTLQKRK